jgi:hypothetical protein
MNIFTQFFSKYFSNSEYSAADIERDLIHSESKIGRELFGPIPRGVKREFFCLDESTWVWHEEKNGIVNVTRYVIKPTEIIKSVDGGNYHRLSIVEAERFCKAVALYSDRVNDELYGQLQTT